jgi:hypothetical protein
MANGNGKRVGRIRRIGRNIHIQQPRDHLLNLVFLRTHEEQNTPVSLTS